MSSVRPELKSRRIPPSEGTRVGSCENLESRLNAYVLAAAAAGAGLLATAQSAAAEIVYTPADTILTNGILRIDLNHDGIDDVALGNFDYPFKEKLLRARGLTPKNAILGYGGGTSYPPAALTAGYRIGPAGQFWQEENAAVRVVASHASYVGGPFANVHNRFLGIVFDIDNQPHYGWVRLSVKAYINQHKPHIDVTLLGYAYETVPGQSLRAGQIDSEVGMLEPIPQAGTLGMLAMGRSLWRRKEQDGTELVVGRSAFQPAPTS
jgi:hypothetical protein